MFDYFQFHVTDTNIIYIFRKPNKQQKRLGRGFIITFNEYDIVGLTYCDTIIGISGLEGVNSVIGGEDAIKASGILDIVLTKRANGAASEIELAGFPHHALHLPT